MATPFMPKAKMPLTMPLYMLSHSWTQEIIAIHFRQISVSPVGLLGRGVTVHALSRS